MNKSLFTAFCAAVIFTQTVSFEVRALEAEALPLNEEITLPDVSGRVYIHMQSSGVLDIMVDKTEPEGIFRYYDTTAGNTEQQLEKLFFMDLSCCEYLIDSGIYASYYTINMAASADKNAYYEQDIVIKDPGFESIESSEYHFYITMKPAESSVCSILNSNEKVTEDDTYICEQYIEISYIPLLGDVNGDGKTDISDATAVLEYYAKNAAGIEAGEFTDDQGYAADVNSDGIIDIADATKILEIYANNAAGIERSVKN